jgi:hypothetical protein
MSRIWLLSVRNQLSMASKDPRTRLQKTLRVDVDFELDVAVQFRCAGEPEPTSPRWGEVARIARG